MASPWSDYQIMIWQPQTPRQLVTLRSIGVSAGEVHLLRKDAPETLSRDEIDPLVENNLAFYVENIATDFYSTYHRWFPDRPVNWQFQAAQNRYLEHPDDLRALWRDPSLSDPRWLRTIRDRLIRTVHAHARYQPLFYNLADEPGIAELSVFWDFDFSPPSLSAMRAWLQERYGTLKALNNEWGTDFIDWSSVIPMTTREAMARTDENFAPWADFKAWMDAAFARALWRGTDAVHKGDPSALAALEGAQVPGWGGYDYSRLARAVDVMEVYDGSGNFEILRSLNPRMTLLTTSASGGLPERYQAWRELLRGSRGLILWDPNNELAHEDGTLGDRGRLAEPTFRELRSGIGALLINSEQVFDPVAILYSPASMRTQWMLDWKPRGDQWLNRDIKDSYEDDSPVRTAMMAYAQRFERLGVHPRFLTPELVEQGELIRGDYRILVLPHAISLSDAEVSEIRAFAGRGGTIIGDVEPGAFDEHSRQRDKSPLGGLFANSIVANKPPLSSATATGLAYLLLPGRNSCSPACRDSEPSIEEIIARCLAPPRFVATNTRGERPDDIVTYRFRNGSVELFAVQRREPLAGGGGSDTSATPIRIDLSRAAYLYDVRRHRDLGWRTQVDLTLDPVEPTLLSASPSPLPSPTVSGPSEIGPTETARFRIGFVADEPAAVAILRADVSDPTGAATRFSRNLQTRTGAASLEFSLAANDPSGTWHIRVTDVLGGQSASAEFEVHPIGSRH